MSHEEMSIYKILDSQKVDLQRNSIFLFRDDIDRNFVKPIAESVIL